MKRSKKADARWKALCVDDLRHEFAANLRVAPERIANLSYVSLERERELLGGVKGEKLQKLKITQKLKNRISISLIYKHGQKAYIFV